MLDQPIQAGDSPADDDLRDQGVVLFHVLALHPAHLIVPELVREITAGSADYFAGGDAVERAVRDLTGVGLLDCPGGLVRPTRAAVHFDRLPQP